ncbi:MAG: hypothetical protein PHT41_02080 [Candidatus Omnitrophica bacterium]|nr:hypothetical protein [Candidatus Omnitrophota bacterium]MDD5237891.1 hypothetical protein [Candidatus Omnitrophota bacterium]
MILTAKVLTAVINILLLLELTEKNKRGSNISPAGIPQKNGSIATLESDFPPLPWKAIESKSQTMKGIRIKKNSLLNHPLFLRPINQINRLRGSAGTA